MSTCVWPVANSAASHKPSGIVSVLALLGAQPALDDAEVAVDKTGKAYPTSSQSGKERYLTGVLLNHYKYRVQRTRVQRKRQWWGQEG